MAQPQAPLVLRRGSEADATALARFAAKAFWDTYREIDDPQDIEAYVAEHFSVASVAAVLRDPACTTLLAHSAHELAGYAVLKLAEPPTCVDGPAPIELARFYLDKAFIGKGNGFRFMGAIHDCARRLGGETLWLGVYDQNVRAVRFYERVGFRKVGGKEFLFGGRIYVDPIYACPVRDA